MPHESQRVDLSKYGPTLKEQGINFFRRDVKEPGAMHDHWSMGAGNMLYYIALESVTDQLSDLPYPLYEDGGPLWADEPIMIMFRHRCRKKK